MEIDAVFTWVDGSDPAFVALRNKHADFAPPPPLLRWQRLSSYTGEYEARENPIPPAVSDARYRNMDELRYALRALSKNAPWIRQIHIVTNGQRPQWLDSEHPRINIVSHIDIFENSDCLPCFNSNAIELNLHRIPGLSENFLYLNDDFFLGRPVAPGDFLDPMGTAKLFVEAGKPLPQDMDDRSLISHIWAYNHALLMDRQGQNPDRLLFAHCPQLYNRSQLAKLVELWPEECALTLRHRVRTPFDVAFRILYTYMDGNARDPQSSGGTLTELGPEDYIFAKLGDDRTDYLEDLQHILLRRPKFFCINDEIPAIETPEGARLRYLLQDLLEHYFPEPSPFERDAPVPLEPMALDDTPPVPEIEGLVLLGTEAAGHEDPILEFRNGTAPDQTWTALWPDISPWLQPEDQLRLSGPEETEIWLTLEMRCPQDHQEPERGFPPPRLIRLPLQNEGKTGLPIGRLIDTCWDRLARCARLEALAAPVLDQPSNRPMSHFLQANRQIRAGLATPDLLRQLDHALLGGIDVFWICHRRALIHLQLGDNEALTEDVRVAIATPDAPWRIFLDLAEALVANDRHTQGLSIAKALRDHDQARPDALYLQSLCRRALNLPDPEFDLLIDPNIIRPRNIGLWAQVVLGKNQDPAAALKKLEPLTARAPAMVELASLRFSLLSRIGSLFRSRVEMHHLLTLTEDATKLMPLAERELAAGNCAGQLIVLEGIRAMRPDFIPAERAWAEAMLDQGDTSEEISTILAQTQPEDNEQIFWSGYHRIRAALAREESQQAQTILLDLLPQDAHVADLVYIAREQQQARQPEAALMVLSTLREFHPDRAEVQLNWAEQMINQGQASDGVLNALDRAGQAGSDEFWTGYHRVRAYLLCDDLEQATALVRSLTRDEHGAQAFQYLGQQARESGNERSAFHIFDAIRDALPAFGPAILPWADTGITLGRVGSDIESALDEALVVGTDPFWVEYHRLRLALARQDIALAETSCRAVAALEQDTGPFQELIASSPTLSVQDSERLAELCRH